MKTKKLGHLFSQSMLQEAISDASDFQSILTTEKLKFAGKGYKLLLREDVPALLQVLHGSDWPPAPPAGELAVDPFQRGGWMEWLMADRGEGELLGVANEAVNPAEAEAVIGEAAAAVADVAA